MTDTVYDPGHVYVHRGHWPHSKPWAPRKGECRHAVHEGGRGVGFHQCGNKAKVTRRVKWQGEEQDMEFCGIHDPVKAAERRRKRDARVDAELALFRRRAAKKSAQNDAVDLIKQIAEGHNDARGLAMAFMAKYGYLFDDEGRSG